MLGNDFVNSSCPLGQGRLNKVSLVKKVKDFNAPINNVESLVLTNYKLLRGIDFNSTKDYEILVTDRGGIIDRSSSLFSPETIDLQIYSLTELDRVKRFVRSNLHTLALKLEFDQKTLFCDVVYTGDSINYFTVLDKWSISFTRTSMYYKINRYDFRNDYDVVSGNSLTKYVVNAGDIEADIQVFSTAMAFTDISITQTYDPVMYPNTSPTEQAFNSLQMSNIFADTTKAFHFSSVLNNYYIIEQTTGTPNYRDITNLRSFSTKGFLTVSQGNVGLTLDGFVIAVDPDQALEVYIFEYYYNI